MLQKINKVKFMYILEGSCSSNGTPSSRSDTNTNENYEKKYPMFEKLFGNRNLVDPDCDSSINK